MALGDVQVKIGADVSGLKEGITRSHRMVSGLGDVMRTAVGTALGFGAAIAGIKAISAAFGFAKESVFGLNNRLQQAQIAFTTMLGSGQAAKAFLDDLARFAAKTPFEFPDLVTATQRMMAYGFEAKQVIPLMTAVGNATAALGGGAAMIDRVTTALGQMRAKGKATGEEMRQLTEAGIPIWDMLAKKLGTDVAGAMEKVSKKAVDANTVIEAFIEGVGERFPGMMEKQSRTFAGAMSTIKDSLQMAVATGLKPFFDIATSALVKLAEILSSDRFQEAVQRFAGALGGFFSDIRDTFEDTAMALEDGVVTLGERVGIFLRHLVSALGGFFSDIRDTFEDTAMALEDGVVTLGERVGIFLRHLVSALGGFFSDIRDTFEDTAMALEDRVVTFGERVGIFLRHLVSALQGFFSDVRDTFEDTAMALEDRVVTFGERVGIILRGVYEGVRLLVTGDLRGGFLGLTENHAVVKALLAIHDAIGRIFSALVLASQTLFSTLSQPGVASGLMAILNPLGALAREVLPALMPLFPNLVEALARIVSEVGPPAAQLLGQLGAILGDAIAQILPPVLALLQRLAPIFAQILATLGPLIAQGFQALISTILPPLIDWLSKLVGWTTQNEIVVKVLAGAIVALVAVMNPVPAVIAGVVAAVALLKRHWEDAASFFTSAVPNAIEAVKGKLSSIPVVGPIIEGFLNQMMALFQFVWNTIRTIVETAMGVIKGVIKTVTSLIRGDWKGAWEGIKGIAESIWNGIKGLVENYIRLVKDTIGNYLGMIRGIWDDVWNGIKGAAERAGDAIKSAITGAFQAMVEGVRGTLGDLFVSIAKIPGQILQALGDMGRLLWDAGRALIEGLIGGIKDKLDDLRDTLGGIKNKITRWKGPLADDQRLLVPAGQAIMGGLVVGLNSGMSDVREALQDASSTITSEMAGLSSSVNRTVFSIADALGELRNHLAFTEKVVAATVSRMQQSVVDGVSRLVSAITGSSPEVESLADAVSAVTSRIVDIINRSTFAVANALSELRPHIWITARAFKAAADSIIDDALEGLVRGVNRAVFSIANALSELRPHFWITARAFQSAASTISEAMEQLLESVNNRAFSIANALSELRSHLAVMARALEATLSAQGRTPAPAGATISDLHNVLEDVSPTITSAMAGLRDDVNRATFDIANALSELRNHLIFTENVFTQAISRIRQKVVGGVSGLISALTEGSPEVSELASAIAAATARIEEVINRSVFSIANALSELRPHLWITARTFESVVSNIREAMTGIIETINQGVFSAANALSELRPHLWITAQAFRSTASSISEVLAGLVQTVNEKVFSISDALSQLRSQLSLTARAFESSLLRSPTNYAAPQPAMQAIAARPGLVAATTAPVINITVQERDVAGEVERVLRRLLWQAGW